MIDSNACVDNINLSEACEHFRKPIWHITAFRSKRVMLTSENLIQIENLLVNERLKNLLLNKASNSKTHKICVVELSNQMKEGLIRGGERAPRAYLPFDLVLLLDSPASNRNASTELFSEFWVDGEGAR
jgi:hypothetical protein